MLNIYKCEVCGEDSPCFIVCDSAEGPRGFPTNCPYLTSPNHEYEGEQFELTTIDDLDGFVGNLS